MGRMISKDREVDEAAQDECKEQEEKHVWSQLRETLSFMADGY